MGRKKETGETIEEHLARLDKSFEDAQKSIYRREVTFNTDNYVVMANNMILYSASNLSMNELKLLRFIIMQTQKDDKELYEFAVNVKDLARSIEISEKNLSRDLRKMTKHLLGEVIEIGDSENKRKWKQFQWLSKCEYDEGILHIKIHDELKPFLVGLYGGFTKYRYSEIVPLRSIFAVKIYESLVSYMKNNLPYANHAVEISISIEELRRVTDTTDKFDRYSSFKLRVIDTAIKEINEKAIYHVTATPYKRGKAVAGFDFLIESQAGYNHRTKMDSESIDIVPDQEQLEGQKTIWDYETTKNHFEIEREEQ